jgi:hypothetical protein
MGRILLCSPFSSLLRKKKTHPKMKQKINTCRKFFGWLTVDLSLWFYDEKEVVTICLKNGMGSDG